jgi:hypothetical protein
LKVLQRCVIAFAPGGDDGGAQSERNLDEME